MSTIDSLTVSRPLNLLVFRNFPFRSGQEDNQRNRSLERAYLRLANNCSTPNEHRKLNIKLETYLGADQWVRIEDVITQQHGRISTWLAKQSATRFLAGRFLPKSKFYFLVSKVSHAHKFSSRDLRRNQASAQLVKAQATRTFSHFVHSENTTRSLLILWTGSGLRPMMPLSIFLEGVRPLQTDVLIIRPDYKTRRFARVQGFGDTLPEAILGVSDFITNNNYQHAYCLGLSLGTLPAVLSTTVPNIKRTLIAGPVSPSTIAPELYGEFATQLQKKGIRPKVIIAVGTDAPKDLLAADTLGEVFETEITMVKNAQHNPPWVYAQRGQLDSWLRQHLIRLDT